MGLCGGWEWGAAVASHVAAGVPCGRGRQRVASGAGGVGVNEGCGGGVGQRVDVGAGQGWAAACGR